MGVTLSLEVVIYTDRKRQVHISNRSVTVLMCTQPHITAHASIHSLTHTHHRLWCFLCSLFFSTFPICSPSCLWCLWSTKFFFNLFGAILFDAMSQNVACSPLVGQESTACAPWGYLQLKSKFEITIKYIWLNFFFNFSKVIRGYKIKAVC